MGILLVSSSLKGAKQIPAVLDPADWTLEGGGLDGSNVPNPRPRPDLPLQINPATHRAGSHLMIYSGCWHTISLFA